MFEVRYQLGSRLLIVYALAAIEIGRIEDVAHCIRRDTGAFVQLLGTLDPDAPDIRIWDLNNIQNGDPIPPEIIEKLKETVNANSAS